ncbi:uncharacterized protein LOC142587104 isoform X2 [Dermacentor variabilis]|uniref:uncharacterized protein LOC142587104 isoform X2 n=1 Tax=Dermacentor variabilis TaxID=34621 RepID=UPI003F5BB4A3
MRWRNLFSVFALYCLTCKLQFAQCSGSQSHTSDICQLYSSFCKGSQRPFCLVMYEDDDDIEHIKERCRSANLTCTAANGDWLQSDCPKPHYQYMIVCDADNSANKVCKCYCVRYTTVR